MGRAIGKNGLMLNLVDDEEFRKVLKIACQCGMAFLNGDGSIKLSHSKKFADKIMPKVDVDTDTKNAAKIAGIVDVTGCMLVSDSWTSVQNRCITNCLQSTPAGARLVEALDTSGTVKSAEWLADFLANHARNIGTDKVVAVCMDGACKPTFKHIEAMEDLSHVFCFICPPHAIDNFIENVMGNKDKNQIGKHGPILDWDEDIFSAPAGYAWDVIKFVNNHSGPLALFREIAGMDDTWLDVDPKPNFTEFVKYVDTRFASKILMCIRYQALKPPLEILIAHPKYKAWIRKQKEDVRERAQAITDRVQDRCHWREIELLVRTMTPVLECLRAVDGKDGAYLSTIYAMMLKLDKLFCQPIDGMDPDITEKIHEHLMKRWEYFHNDVFTAAYFLDPRHIKSKPNTEDKKGLQAVFRKMANIEHPIGAIMTDYASLRVAIDGKTKGFDEEEAFSEYAKKQPGHLWAQTFLYEFPHLQWVATRILSLRASASDCERSWSIEAWIHSNKRNRLGQKNVERLVRVHTNLHLETVLEDWQDKVLPWEVEMVMDEPEDEDPHGGEGTAYVESGRDFGVPDVRGDVHDDVGHYEFANRDNGDGEGDAD